MSDDRHPKRLPPPVSDENAGSIVGWITDVVRQGRLAWRLFWDRRVPLWTKLIPPAVLAYLILPTDILPDIALGLGQLDDMAVLLIGAKLFIELSPAEIVREHLVALGARIKEWRVQDGEEEPPPTIEGEYEIAEIAGGEVETLEIVEGEEVEIIEAEEEKET
jgi:uncharacterized membrane protein YkvA (DUF1232 family)